MQDGARQEEETDEFPGFIARVGALIAQIAYFPFQWGIPPKPDEPEPPPEHAHRRRLFRFEARRLKRMIDEAEHLIRCLIIWRAYRAVRDGEIAPRRFTLPPETAPKTPRPPERPVHPLFAAGTNPLYDPKPPAFRIALPAPSPGEAQAENNRSSESIVGERGWGEVDQSQLLHQALQATQSEALYPDYQTPDILMTPSERAGKRRRNDDIVPHEKLYLRLERLGKLHDEIDKRALRYAAYWSARLRAELPVYKKELAARVAVAVKAGLSPDLTGLRRPELFPLNSSDPPPDLTAHAEPETRSLLDTLNDVGFRAAELFTQHCG